MSHSLRENLQSLIQDPSTSPNSSPSPLLGPYTYTGDFVAGVLVVRCTALWPLGLTRSSGGYCSLLPPIILFLVLPAA
jgi:hypothetical protein